MDGHSFIKQAGVTLFSTKPDSYICTFTVGQWMTRLLYLPYNFKLKCLYENIKHENHQSKVNSFCEKSRIDPRLHHFTKLISCLSIISDTFQFIRVNADRNAINVPLDISSIQNFNSSCTSVFTGCPRTSQEYKSLNRQQRFRKESVFPRPDLSYWCLCAQN